PKRRLKPMRSSSSSRWSRNSSTRWSSHARWIAAKARSSSRRRSTPRISAPSAAPVGMISISAMPTSVPLAFLPRASPDSSTAGTPRVNAAGGGGSADLDPPRLRRLRLPQRQRQHAVLELGADLLLVDLVREAEAPREVADIVFGIERLQPLVLAEVDAAFDAQHVLLELDVDLLLLDAGQLHDDGERVLGVVDIRGRDVVARRRRLLLLAHELLLLADLERLVLLHDPLLLKRC